MASSDDEEVVVPQSVTNYHFVDKDGVPISFSTLPIILDDDEKAAKAEDPGQHVSLRGTMDGGLQSVFKDVVAWKLKLDGDGPEVYVHSKDNQWIKLEKPKKSYEECIRTTLVTMHLLHFSKNNPEASVKSFWEHVRQALSSLDDKPSQDDFKGHIQVIKLFLEKDEALANSQILLTFVKNPEKALVEDFHNSVEERPFIIDDELEDGIGIDDGDESEEESDLFDSVCSICDNGGELLCCEGRCLRSFHATRKAGADSDCASLGLTRIQVEAMQNFLCKNCQLKQHQCFACGKLGSSDKSSNAEVYSCVSATCGHFYHPKCVADLLFPENKIEATELGKRIAAGESFTCPAHRCFVCKQVENKEVEDFQFAICRRCPKSYHRKCMPRKISFDDIEEEDIIQRAWDGLLPNRILIYCLKHEIDEELGTPYRDHIKFPELPEKKREADVQKPKLQKNKLASDRMAGNLKFPKPAKRFEKVPTDSEDKISGKYLDSQNKWKISMKDAKPAGKKVESKEFTNFGSTKAKPILGGAEKTKVPNSAASVHGKLINSAPKIMPEIRKDVLSLVEEESASLTQDDIRKMLSTPSTYSSSVGHIDKSITLGKIEGAIEAVRTALQKLEAGGNVEDAKAVCEPEILKRLIKWNVKLKVYLAPVLHGARYSSYGRHFTKYDKLQEIVDKLQWYVQDGDMVVDFCCGANEFSILMKETLDAAKKKCSFKNYDILQAKNDFNFEMRDWMTVRPNELPTGSKLIMGLNPPFGLNARLANQFIDKALTFKPKLLILIVPEETRRLDTKNPQYDLIWEDRASLSGKSFYLPGSIDVNDKQIEQWNVRPPVLYLWSRPDWTAKNKGIASSQGHTSKMLSDKNNEEKYKERNNSQGERENMSVKQKGHDHTSLMEPASGIDAQIQVERREEAAPQQQREMKKKHIKERSEKSQVAPPSHHKESGKEGQNKKQRVERRPEKTAAGREAEREKDGRPDSGKKNPELNKKRKSPELSQEGGGMDSEELPNMSISPPNDRRGPLELSTTKKLGGAFEMPSEGENNNHRGYIGSGSGIDMRNISSAGRTSGIHEDPADMISRRYNSVERDSFYKSSSPPTEVYGRDYSFPNSYNSQFSRNGFGGGRGDDADLRMQSRSSSMPGEEMANSGYGRSFRNYSMQLGEEVYGRSIDSDIRSRVRSYGGMSGEEDLPQGNRLYSLGGSGHSGLYPSSSTYRLSGTPAAETPAMQQLYAPPPRLDEAVNHSRSRHMSPGIPMSPGLPMSPGIPFPGRDISGMRRDIPTPDSFGFAPGTSPFPNHGGGSFGWIDD